MFLSSSQVKTTTQHLVPLCVKTNLWHTKSIHPLLHSSSIRFIALIKDCNCFVFSKYCIVSLCCPITKTNTNEGQSWKQAIAYVCPWIVYCDQTMNVINNMLVKNPEINLSIYLSIYYDDHDDENEDKDDHESLWWWLWSSFIISSSSFRHQFIITTLSAQYQQIISSSSFNQ